MVRKIAAAAIAALFVPVVQAAGWEKLWTFEHGAGTSVDGQTSEILAFDSLNNELWVGGLKGVDILNAATGSFVQHIDTTAFGELNSVAVRNGVAAFAIAAPIKTDAGSVLTYDTTSRSFQQSYLVGALPDMVTFTADGRIMTANEGEPLARPGFDTIEQRGSISIIDTTKDSVTTLGFAGYDGTTGLGRVVTPGSKPSIDWEPEYIALSKDGQFAMVTLQEANAVAKIDLLSQQIVSVTSLGLKDHSLPGNELDTSDRDGPGNSQLAGNYRNAPVFGMYMPDAIASYASGGKTYYITANEGDSRNLEDFVDGEFNEEVRVGSSSYVLDPTVFPDAAALKANSNLGRLTATTSGGDLDGDGDYDQIHIFGGRSFSILDEDGNQVFDSGNDLEARLFAAFPALIDDGRSDNKGVEPEGVTVLELGDRTLAFIGFERSKESVIAIYDVTNPTAATFVDFIVDADSVSPEGLSAYEFGGKYFLATANEVSGTTSLFSITPVPEPETYAMLLAGLGLIGLAARRRRG
ncbi:choice-of-anchor I family protein [Methyloversatilis sp. XJ19-49]|uniref:choice-of-anchor I family protein n=1 Tax=Methyloversatilis sp. XJ19-49 TaxID=2963429 RepID=UPI00211C88C8|nr:choice-of-anchor I family protein [Methyloversatilis sp. XJ19-49]MCQ9380090.1 choice-of-anchor I family protein [Methyloversatilis sp. XJ19-49]MCQ9380122.1 choice-of-anchor I family protein [Methyloversatilis sp. XJ19-49]